MRKARRAIALLACAGALGLGALVEADDASAACGHWHADPFPTYTGPVPVGLMCGHWGDPAYTWTVPAEVTTAHFSVFGGDDPIGERAGGRVEARLDLTPGSELTLLMGGEGEASFVRLGEEALLVAGGGDGAEPNFVTPSASEVETEEPGAPRAEPFSNGRIDVEWTYWFEGEDAPDEESVTWPVVMPPPLAGGQSPGCIVPRLRGLRPIAARKALVRANCSLGSITRRAAQRHRHGRILRQTPTAGASLPLGATVAVVVGRRP